MKNKISGNEGMNKQKKNEIKIGKWRMISENEVMNIQKKNKI